MGGWQCLAGARTDVRLDAKLQLMRARQSAWFAGDAQSRYYGLAHSVTEVVTEQPKMLVGPSACPAYSQSNLHNHHLIDGTIQSSLC